MEGVEYIPVIVGCIYLFGILFMMLTMSLCYYIFIKRVRAAYADIDKLPIDTMYNQWVGNTYWVQPPIPILAKFAEPEITKAAKGFNNWVRYFWI